MSRKRKVYAPKLKLQVVLELLAGRKTQAEITSEYGVHASQQIKWKKQLLEQGVEIFEDKRTKISKEKDHEKQIESLYQQIGQLSVERNWLQKKIGEFPELHL